MIDLPFCTRSLYCMHCPPNVTRSLCFVHCVCSRYCRSSIHWLYLWYWNAQFVILQLLRGVESQCPERFSRADCYINAAEDRYYIAPRNISGTYKNAKSMCKKLGGALAVVDTTRESEFLSGLASNAGSWIGLKRKRRAWRWSGSRKIVNGSDEIWALHSNENFPDNDCAVMDRRGLSHNVQAVRCDAEMHFICEFDSSNVPSQCKVRVLCWQS